MSVWFTVRLLLASIFVSSISSVLEYYSWSYSGLIQPEFNYGTLWYLEQPLPRIVTKDFVGLHFTHTRIRYIYNNNIVVITIYNILEQSLRPKRHFVLNVLFGCLLRHSSLLWVQDLQDNEEQPHN